VSRVSAAGSIDLLGRLDAIVFEAQAATLQLGFVAGGAMQRLGFPASEWLEDAQFLVRHVGGDEREALLGLMRAAAADGQPRQIEHSMIAADGSERWFRTEINPIDRGQRLLVLMIDTTTAHETARALRETEARLRQVIDKAPIILLALDREGRVTLAEGSGLRPLKLTTSDLLGRSVLELMAHEEAALGHIRRALAGEELIATAYVRAYDSWWETRWTPLFDERGHLAGATAVALDVSARYRAELELAQTISLLRATLEATTDGVLVVDTAGHIVDYNRRFVEMWRLPCDVLDGGDDAVALAAVVDQLRDPDGFLAKVRALYAEPDATSHDLLEFRDGRVFSRDSHPQRVEGECVGRVWSFRDVTGEYRATRRAAFLAEASKVLAAITDETALDTIARLSVPFLGDWCNIMLYDEHHRLRCAAAHHRDPSKIPILRAITPPSINVRRGLGLILAEGRPAMFNDLTEAELRGELSPRGPFALTDEEHLGKLRQMGMRHWMGAPVLVRGRVAGLLAFAVSDLPRRYNDDDVETAQELAQRAALALENQRLYRATQQAVVLRDEFLSVASHELRTPVTSLQLAVQSALTVGLTADAPQDFLRQALESAERQTRRLGRLVDALLDVSRIEAGRLELNREPTDLAQLAREVVRVLAEDLRRAGCEVVLDVPAELIGYWDRARLEQVMTNLLSNAFKYGAGRPIDVIVAGAGEVARLTVRDRGIGVPEGEHGRIFERFERAVSARHYGGLGLGLYIVRRIVDAHGGRAMVTSPEGGGAAFTVELPIAEPGI
jgi:PAS domain S-box-containing protein